MNWKERLLGIDWKHWAVLFLVFVLAFGIRAYLLRYELMFEFDTYWHARMTGEIIQHGSPPAIEPLAYYQLGEKAVVPLRTQLFWYVSAFFYFIAALLTTGSLAYNKALLIEVVKFLPAFYGALVVVGMYLLGKEAYGKRAGYLMAFFGAVSASFVYRSMAGFFEAGTFAYVFIIFGFYFTLRAVNRMENTRSAIINGVIAGILLGSLAHIYALFVIIPLIFGMYLVFTFWGLWGHDQKTRAVRFAQIVIGIFVVFFVVTLTGINPDWLLGSTGNVTTALGRHAALVPLLVVAGIAAIGIMVFFLLRSQNQKQSAEKQRWIQIVRTVLLLVIVAVTLLSMITPRERVGISAISVGEESPGHLYFFHKFSILLIFPFLALILIPLIDFKKSSPDLASLLLFPFILISLYIAWDRLHYSYNLGVPLAIAAAYVTHFVLTFFEKRARSERVIVGILLGFMVLAGAASATLFTQNNTPTIELDTGWKEGLQWLEKNSPPDAKMFNWWDEGHWITFLAERRVITDNRNFDQYANADVGKFVLTEDFNEAVRILKKYDSDYIVLGADLFSKRNSMLLYAFYIDDPSKFQGNDPRLDAVPSFDVPCGKQESNGTVSFQCGNATLPEAQMNSIPLAWTSQPSAIPDNRNPIFYYRTADNARVYQLSLKQNQTVFAKIWFGAPEMAPFFEEVFPNGLPGYRNKELKIFKIRKEKFS